MASKSDDKGKDVVPFPPEMLAEFSRMASIIPEGADGAEAQAEMLRRILAAEDATQLDSPWGGATADMLDRPQRVTELKRLPSDFKDGLGVFLVVDAVDEGTGEMVTWTTGAVSVVGQLVKAYAAGWLPLACILRQSEKPSANGYYAQHLEIMRDKVPFPS